MEQDPLEGQCLLEIELTTKQEVPLLPEWAGTYRDVTTDPAYSNVHLAVKV